MILNFKVRCVVTMVCSLLLLYVNSTAQNKSDFIFHFILTSDVHFGLVKENFRKHNNVPSREVNAAMIEEMNSLPEKKIPNDTGVDAGKLVKSIEAIAITGDLTNREEKGVQSATNSWKDFLHDYSGLVKLTTKDGKTARLLVTPGNHDVSNTIGYQKPMKPLNDPASMIGIYNLMMHPVTKKTSATYTYKHDKVHYSVNIANIHFMFVNLWPDSAERLWMIKDLAKVKSNTPVFLFAHSMPDVEARFFINPNGKHDINIHDKFENLVTETFKDGNSINDLALQEQRALATFLKQHSNIKVYFHGHSNFTEFYEWKGPDNNIDLHCVRADSPMKGKYSAKDETKLSFELVSVNTKTKQLTVREILWNNDPLLSGNRVSWGTHATISF